MFKNVPIYFKISFTIYSFLHFLKIILFSFFLILLRKMYKLHTQHKFAKIKSTIKQLLARPNTFIGLF